MQCDMHEATPWNDTRMDELLVSQSHSKFRELNTLSVSLISMFKVHMLMIVKLIIVVIMNVIYVTNSSNNNTNCVHGTLQWQQGTFGRYNKKLLQLIINCVSVTSPNVILVSWQV